MPFGWLILKRAKRRATRASISALGLTPGHRGTGANLVLYASMARNGPRLGFTGGTVTQIDSGNERMMRNLEMLGVQWTIRHRLYHRELSDIDKFKFYIENTKLPYNYTKPK